MGNVKSDRGAWALTRGRNKNSAGTIYLRFNYAGDRYEVSTKTTNWADAAASAPELYASLVSGAREKPAPMPPPPPPEPPGEPVVRRRRFPDLTGSRVGTICVLGRGEPFEQSSRVWWLCLCDCGQECAHSGAVIRRAAEEGLELSCVECSEIRRYRATPQKTERDKLCYRCGSLPHRVEGETCSRCGLSSGPMPGLNVMDFAHARKPGIWALTTNDRGVSTCR